MANDNGFSAGDLRLHNGLLARFRPESKYIVAIGLVMGSLSIVVVPPVSTYDGPSHYFRAVQIAQGRFRANRYSERQLGGSSIRRRDSRFVHTLWSSYWPGHHFLNLSEWSAISQIHRGDGDHVYEEFTNTAVYSPANYVPQSVALALTRILTRSPLWGHRAACTLNLLCYLALIVLALETMPRFQASLLLVASSPFLLMQAATFNLDGINFAVPMCLFALVWKMRSGPGSDHGLRLAAVTGLAWWTTLLKPTDVICLGFLFFIPEKCFDSGRKKAAWLIAAMGIASGLWLFWNRPYLDVNIAGWFDPAHPAVSAQKTLLLHHPEAFFSAFGASVRHDFSGQWKALYGGGVGGWIPDWMQFVVYRLSWAFLIVVVIESARNPQRDWRWAIICLAHAVALLLFIAVTLWVSYGVQGTDYIPYLGGRYLFLVFAFGLVAWSDLAGWRFRTPRNYLLIIGLSVNVLCLGLILTRTALMVAG